MENKKKNKKIEVRTVEKIARAKPNERIATRGRIFQGKVIKKFQKRAVIEFERFVYIRKYERYAKSKTRLHARIPPEFEGKINIGDLIKIRECRPLSKIVHFLVIEKVKDAEEIKQPLEEKK